MSSETQGDQGVWVIESGEYEDHCVFGLAADLDAGVRFIKAEYSDPYRVDWWPLDDSNPDAPFLRGDFESVRGWSTHHTAYFEFRRMEVAR